MKRWSFTYLYDSRLLIISDLENTSVLVLGRSVALGFKRWKFSYHQLERVPFRTMIFFFFWKSILSSYKGHVILAFLRQRALEWGENLNRRAEQRRQIRTISIRALPHADGAGGILSGHPGFQWHQENLTSSSCSALKLHLRILLPLDLNLYKYSQPHLP